MTKTCRRCEMDKPLEDFHLRHTTKDGRDASCKECRLKSQKDDYHNRTEHYLWKRAKNRAKRENLEFDISEEDIFIPERCPILDIPLFIVPGQGGENNSPSLDRIDNSKGYIKGNVSVISLQANRMKLNLDVKDVELLARSMDRFIRYLKGEL